jgi:hypothetical protein
MLPDDASAIDAHHFSVGECLAYGLACLLVKVGLCVGGKEYGSVDNKEVGICGWQSLLTVEYRLWHGEFYQAVWLPLGCA